MSKSFSKVSQIARLLAKDAKPALLSTIGLNGAPKSRYIGTFKIRDTGEMFFISPSKSRKIQEIQRNSQTQVIFSSQDCKRVLTLSGGASIVEDLVLRRRLYEETKPLKIYPIFNDYFGVIHFMPVYAEYLDINSSDDPVVINMMQD